jgi:hypothetical protein
MRFLGMPAWRMRITARPCHAKHSPEIDCMAENAVRSETVSRVFSLQFAICRVISGNCRESRCMVSANS